MTKEIPTTMKPLPNHSGHWTSKQLVDICEFTASNSQPKGLFSNSANVKLQRDILR